MRDGMTVEWVEMFLKDIEQSIESKASISGLLPDDEERAVNVLKALNSISQLAGREMLERVFSLRFFGDSKYFEKKIKKKITGIIKKYYLGHEIPEDITDNDVLMQVGIVQSPEQVDFKGNIYGHIKGETVDFSAFIHGISINANTVRDLTIEGMGSVKRVLFIENKANYIDFTGKNKDDTFMAVYHGGFYSPLKGMFFKKIYDASLPYNVEFYHWGDIDLGGFLMFRKLKEEIIPCLKPYLMDSKALNSKTNFGIRFDDRYRNRLKNLLKDSKYSVFHDVIKLMLKKGIRLEQEAFII
jgi:hypothetical protein